MDHPPFNQTRYLFSHHPPFKTKRDGLTTILQTWKINPPSLQETRHYEQQTLPSTRHQMTHRPSLKHDTWRLTNLLIRNLMHHPPFLQHDTWFSTHPSSNSTFVSTPTFSQIRPLGVCFLTKRSFCTSRHAGHILLDRPMRMSWLVCSGKLCLDHAHDFKTFMCLNVVCISRTGYKPFLNLDGF